MPHSLHGLIQALDNRRCALFDELDTLGVEVLSVKPRPDKWSIHLQNHIRQISKLRKQHATLNA